MVSGFGMFICIATGVCAHFEARFVEEIMAAALTFWRFNLAGDGTAWANPATWEGMFRIASEEVWGAICLAVGDLWLLGLLSTAPSPIPGTRAIRPWCEAAWPPLRP